MRRTRVSRLSSRATPRRGADCCSARRTPGLAAGGLDERFSLADAIREQAGSQVSEFRRADDQRAQNGPPITGSEGHAVLLVVDCVTDVEGKRLFTALLKEAGKIRGCAVPYLDACECHAREFSTATMWSTRRSFLRRRGEIRPAAATGFRLCRVGLSVGMVAAGYATLAVLAVVVVQLVAGGFRFRR